MSIHEFVDNLTVKMGGLYGDSLRFFRESIESPHLAELIADTKMSVPTPDGPGETEVSGRCGETSFETAYYVLSWAGPSAPTLIFHHGSGDFPYHSRLAKILPEGKRPEGVNLIATNIPFNKRNKMEYIRAVGDLSSFALMFASATVLIQGLVEQLRAAGASFISVSGISLGGWITNMHKAYFDSADEYRPIFAGAAPDHLFRESVYRSMVAKSARDRVEAVTDALNFEEAFSKVDNANVYPLMARFDQYILLDRQSGIYRGENLQVIDYGHVTGTMQGERLARHITEGFATRAGTIA